MQRLNRQVKSFIKNTDRNGDVGGLVADVLSGW